MRSQALTVAEAEQARRAAYSDLFPEVTVQYGAVADRYQNSDFIEDLDQKHPSRWTQRMARGRFFNQWVTPQYPYRIDPYRNFQLTATLTQPIYSGGRLVNAYKRSNLAVTGSRLDLEILKQDLILRVLQAYYQVVLADKLREVAEESIRSLREFKARAQAFFEQGEGLRIDVKAAEARLAQSRASRQQAVSSRRTAISMLSLLLAYPQDLDIQVIGTIKNDGPVYRVPEIYEIAMANRIEIRRAGIRVEQAKAAVRIARAGLLPNVDLQLQGVRINDDWNVFDPEGTNDWTIQGTVTWVFDMFRSRSTVQRERTAASKTLVDRQYLIQQILQQTKSAYVNVQRSQSDVSAYRAAAAARSDQFAMAKELYNQQLTTYLHVLEAQEGWEHAKANLQSAKIGLLLGTAQLERQMGILDRRF